MDENIKKKKLIRNIIVIIVLIIGAYFIIRGEVRKEREETKKDLNGRIATLSTLLESTIEYQINKDKNITVPTQIIDLNNVAGTSVKVKENKPECLNLILESGKVKGGVIKFKDYICIFQDDILEFEKNSINSSSCNEIIEERMGLINTKKIEQVKKSAKKIIDEATKHYKSLNDSSKNHISTDDFKDKIKDVDLSVSTNIYFKDNKVNYSKIDNVQPQGLVLYISGYRVTFDSSGKIIVKN